MQNNQLPTSHDELEDNCMVVIEIEYTHGVINDQLICRGRHNDTLQLKVHFDKRIGSLYKVYITMVSFNHIKMKNNGCSTMHLYKGVLQKLILKLTSQVLL